MRNYQLIVFIFILLVFSVIGGGIVNGKTCIQPDFRVYCGYCDGKPTVAETSACANECSATKWKAANEEFNQCIKDGGTPALSGDMQKEIDKVLPGFKLPAVPDTKLPVKEPSLKEPSKETNDYTPVKKLVVRNLKYGKDLKEGDMITGQKGVKTVIHMPNGSIIDVREGGEIKFTSENSLETIKGFFKFLIIKANQRANKFTVRTNVAVAAVRGTEFLVESDESKTTFTALEGAVEVSDPGAQKTVAVTGGNRVVVLAGGLPSDPERFDLASIDRWYEEQPRVSSEPSKEGASRYLFVITSLIILIPVIIILRKRHKKSP